MSWNHFSWIVCDRVPKFLILGIFGRRLGNKIRPKSAPRSKKGAKKSEIRTTMAALCPTWRPKGGKNAPRCLQIYTFLHRFFNFLRKRWMFKNHGFPTENMVFQAPDLLNFTIGCIIFSWTFKALQKLALEPVLGQILVKMCDFRSLWRPSWEPKSSKSAPRPKKGAKKAVVRVTVALWWAPWGLRGGKDAPQTPSDTSKSTCVCIAFPTF